MKVKKIVIYPIKGLPGFSLPKVRVNASGLAHDRLYMIVDSEGNFISQRNSSHLTQMEIKRGDAAWIVSHNNSDLTIEDQKYTHVEIEVEVWEAKFICNEVSIAHSNWFSKQLNMDCKLVVMPSLDTRIKTFSKAPFKTELSFADGYPILTLGTESVVQLNDKLDNSIEANRFRANIIIDTQSPHEEDEWEDFTIGSEVQLRNIKPCVRCEVVTIDQTSGEKGKEPLKTLATYRNFDQAVCFGSNAIVLKEGEIRVGDEVGGI